jgi:hypothetical protein
VNTISSIYFTLSVNGILLLEPFPVAVTVSVNVPVGVRVGVDEPPPPPQEIIAPHNVNVPMVINIPRDRPLRGRTTTIPIMVARNHHNPGWVRLSDTEVRAVVTLTVRFWDALERKENELGLTLHEAPVGAPLQLTAMVPPPKLFAAATIKLYVAI